MSAETAPADAVKQALKVEAARLETYLARCLDTPGVPAGLREAMEYSLLAGGKRVRPALCLIASRLCSVAFIVPFFFMYDPALLMQGEWQKILQVFVTATIGTIGLAGGMERWFFRPLPLPMALLLIVGSCLLIIPGSITDMVGLGTVLVIGAYCKMSSKAGRAASAA